MMRVLSAVLVLVVVGCGEIVSPPRCVEYRSVAMSDSVSRAGSLDVCVAYE